MRTIACPHCNEWFDFDAKKIWSSPGPLLNGTPEQKLVIQCTKCAKRLVIPASELDIKPSDDPRLPAK